MTSMKRPLKNSLLSFALVAGSAASALAAVEDVMLQTMDGKIVTGIVDDGSGIGTLGTRVYRGNFLSNYRAANPGFFGLTSVNPNLPPGASGFPSNHDVNFDLLPMRVGSVSSNLFYWNGSDLGGDGLDLTDVQLTIPSNVNWEVRDDENASIVAFGTDQLVAGGRIQKTSSDIEPDDGVDTGMLHKHLALLLSKTTGGTPPVGVYLIAWQARSAGFETSDPFVFVHRTSTVSNTARDLTADWVGQHLDAMFSTILPGDYNEDSVVDAADYTVWRDLLGTAIALPNEDASPNVVDLSDYEVWRTHFGASLESGAVAAAGVVPEPMTTATLAIALSCVVLVRTPRRPRARAVGRGPESTPPRC